MFLPNFGRTFSRLNSADKWKKTAACPLRDLEEKRTEPSRPFSPPFLHPTTHVRTTCFLTRIWCCYQGRMNFRRGKKVSKKRAPVRRCKEKEKFSMRLYISRTKFFHVEMQRWIYLRRLCFFDEGWRVSVFLREGRFFSISNVYFASSISGTLHIFSRYFWDIIKIWKE